MSSPLSNENKRWIVDIITLLSAGKFLDFKRFTPKIVLNGSLVSVKRNIPNSPSACLPKLLRSTRKSTLRIGVYERKR